MSEPTTVPDASEPPVTPEFRRARRSREGYDRGEVEAFAALVERALEQDPPGLAPYEVVDQRFHVVRRGRGYDLRQVDDWLDEVAEHLRERHGGDPLADLEGHGTPPSGRSRATWWIYGTAAVVVLAVAVAVVLVLR